MNTFKRSIQIVANCVKSFAGDQIKWIIEAILEGKTNARVVNAPLWGILYCMKQLDNSLHFFFCMLAYCLKKENKS